MKVLCLLLGIVASSAALERWVVRDDSNNTCVMLEGDSSATVQFNDGNGTIFKHTVLINQTEDVTGNCNFIYNNQSAQSMSVLFYPNGARLSTAQAWTLDLIFGTDEKAGVAFKLIDYTLTTTPHDSLKGSVSKIFRKGESADLAVQAAAVHAYKCSTCNLALEDQSSVEIKNVKAIAFSKIEGDTFPEGQIYEQCALDAHTSDIVPIIVGACLAGLVIIVLVAYLIGRARAKRQGYASV